MKNKRIRNCVKLPNAIIEDVRLTYSARKVIVAIYASSNALGYSHLGLIQLARRAKCAVSTARAAVSQLVKSGYLSCYQNYGWSNTHGRIIYKRMTYICRIPTRDFTFIPRNLLQADLKKSAFSIYLYLRRVAGNATRAYPSLNGMVQTLGMAKSTVCRAVAEMVAKGLICLEHCIKQNHTFACNSYFFPQPTASAATDKQQPTPTAVISVHPQVVPLHNVKNCIDSSYTYYNLNAETIQEYLDQGGSIIFSKPE